MSLRTLGDRPASQTSVLQSAPHKDGCLTNMRGESIRQEAGSERQRGRFSIHRLMFDSCSDADPSGEDNSEGSTTR